MNTHSLPPAKKELSICQRWSTFFFGMSKNAAEFFITVDLTNTWRRHIVWSKKSGDELKSMVIGRYTSSTVFLSLLFSTEMAVIYSPSYPADQIRAALTNKETSSVKFWAGIALCVSIFFSVSALVANFTAWSVFGSLSKNNAPIILRSNIGLYSAQLPSRLVVAAIYLFLCFVGLTWWVIMPTEAAFLLSLLGIFLIFHIISTYSAIGRVIMLTGAMSEIPIIDEDEEVEMNPGEIGDALLQRACLAKQMKVDVMKQYRFDYQELLRDVEEGKVSLPIPDMEFDIRANRMLGMRRDHGPFRASLQQSTMDRSRRGLLGQVGESSPECPRDLDA